MDHKWKGGWSRQATCLFCNFVSELVKTQSHSGHINLRKQELLFHFTIAHFIMDFPGGSDGKESAWNMGDLGSIPGLWRSPGEGNGYPPVFLPRKFHEQRSLVGYSPWGHKESDTTHFHFTIVRSPSDSDALLPVIMPWIPCSRGYSLTRDWT